MQYQEFVELVRQRADIGSNEKAVSLIRATLETLAEHPAGNAFEKLAAQLPEGIAEFIANHKAGETAEGEGFGVEEFINRAGKRAGIENNDDAKFRLAAVLSVLQESVSREDFDQLRHTFPAEYNTLFELENSEAISTRY